jgi:hypothetical protein
MHKMNHVGSHLIVFLCLLVENMVHLDGSLMRATLDIALLVLQWSVKALAIALQCVGGSLSLRASRANNRILSVPVFAESGSETFRELLHISQGLVMLRRVTCRGLGGTMNLTQSSLYGSRYGANQGGTFEISRTRSNGMLCRLNHI